MTERQRERIAAEYDRLFEMWENALDRGKRDIVPQYERAVREMDVILSILGYDRECGADEKQILVRR